MGPSNLRLAAGVGVVAAAVAVVGPAAAVAIADPGGSHSNHSDHRDRDSRGGWKPGGRDGHGFGGRDRDGGDRDYSGSLGDRDRAGGYDGQRDGDRWGGNDGGSISQPSTSGSDSTQRRTSTSSGSTASLAPQTSTGSQASVDESAPPAPQTPAQGPGSDMVSGADAASPPTGTAVEPPRVVFGNGRSPGIQPHAPEAPPAYFIVPEIAPPPPPVIVPQPPSSTEGPHSQRFAPQFGKAPSTNWSDPFWGLAGLVLIPAAGAVLGYRQAKAARDAEVLTRT